MEAYSLEKLLGFESNNFVKSKQCDNIRRAKLQSAVLHKLTRLFSALSSLKRTKDNFNRELGWAYVERDFPRLMKRARHPFRARESHYEDVPDQGWKQLPLPTWSELVSSLQPVFECLNTSKKQQRVFWESLLFLYPHHQALVCTTCKRKTPVHDMQTVDQCCLCLTL